MQTNSKPRIVPIIAARFLLVAGMTFVLLLNAQPWLEVAGPWVKASIAYIPLLQPILDGIASIPILGSAIAGLILVIIKNLGDLGALTLCALVNLSETSELLLTLYGVDKGAIAPGEKAGSGNDPKSRALGLIENLGTYRMVAYLLELGVVLLAYPLYGDGIGDLMADFSNLDPSLWNWSEIGLAAFSLFGFEAILGTAVTVWTGTNALKVLINGRQSRQTQQQQQDRKQQPQQ